MLMNKIHYNNFLTPPSTELSPFLMADNQLAIANGINLGWKKGSIIKDLGYSKVGDTVESNKPITGLHNYRSEVYKRRLATVNNSAGTNLTLKYLLGSTWTDINVGSIYNEYKDVLAEMENFIGYCFIVGYDLNADVFLPVGSLLGTTFSTSTNVTNMAQGKYIKRYRDRLYVANTKISSTRYPYRVYFSSVPSAGAITWTQATDFFDVDFAEEITGLGANWDRLIVFTEFSAYIYDQDSKGKLGDEGCANHRTIANVGSYLIWANKSNVWASTGGRPTPIANDIKELFLNSDSTKWRSAVVGQEYHLYLGSTEADGLSYSNCLAVFDAELGYWRWRELHDDITALAKYTSGSDNFLYMGAADGDVHVKSKYTNTTPIYADDGKPIIAHFRTKAFDFGDPSVKKTINKVITYCERGQGLAMRFRVWDKNNEIVMPWTEIGKLSSIINSYDKTITGNFIQFEGKEYSKNQPFEFYGISCQLGADNKL
jgi:hypothetical protein